MQPAGPAASPNRLLVPVLIVGGFALCWAAAIRGGEAPKVALTVVLLCCAIALGSRMFAWKHVVAATIVVILLVPIRRYELPGSLPFKLEPYRLLVAALAAGWVVSLLAHSRTRLRRSFLDVPILLVPFVAAVSISVNPGRLADALISEQVAKSLMFLLSFVVFYFVLTSVLHSVDDVDYIVKVLVGAGTIVAAFAIVEARTQFNAFDHLQGIPGLTYVGADAGNLAREGKTRVLGSSQHPIALSAALIMLMPFALYLAQTTRRKTWWLAGGILLMAALATLSRTGVVMLFVVLVVFAWLRPAAVKRLLPLALPLAVAVHFVLPGTIGSFRSLFFPEGGLVAEQAQGKVGSSRGASFGPGMKVVNAHPVLGQGYATRITDTEDANAFIVDDEWLGTAMETGLVGVALWLWVFLRSVRRFGRAARRDSDSRGLLLASLASAIAAFAVGMATFDAFSFIQVTFVLFTLLALGAVAVRPLEAPRPA